jgi:ABC-type transport system substrate-binding protein
MAESRNLDRLARELEARGMNRRDLMKLIGAGAGMSALTTFLGTGATGAAAQTSGGEVRILWRSPVTLNPLFATSGLEQQVVRALFGALVKMSGDLTPTPDLAESVDVAPDGTVFTFTLRENLSFSDGTPLTSADVVFTLERAINPLTASRWKGRLSRVAGAADYDGASGEVEGLKAIDERTVQITLDAPNSAFLVDLCSFSGLGILPKHILGDVAPDALQADPFSLAPTTTAGAFKLVKYETDQYLEMERNPTYPGEVGLDRIFMVILAPDVALAQLETGELDLMTLQVADAERARGLENVTVVNVPSPSIDFLVCNLERPYLQNVKMRQAMMHAIDREGIVAAIFQGEATVVNTSIIGPEWMGAQEGLNTYPYNPDGAKALLAESGFDLSQKLEIIYYPGPPTDDVIAIIQQQLTDVGFKVELVQIDDAELVRRYIEEADYDLLYLGGGVFRADPGISATYFNSANFTPAGGNGAHYANPRVDELFAQGVAQTDLEERKATYSELSLILNEELPFIFLWSPNSIFGFNNRLQGFEGPSYAENKLWNADTWTVSS